MVDAGARRRAAALLREARAGKEADGQVGARPDESQGVEVELVETRRGLPDLLDPPLPGADRVGLVEPADMLEIPPESVDRRRRLELREDDRCPSLRCEGRDRPGDGALVDELEGLLQARQSVSARPRRVDPGQQPGRDDRREDDSGRAELAEVEHAAAEPGRHPGERVLRGRLRSDPLRERVEVGDVHVAGATRVGAARDPVRERRGLGRRLDHHDLVRLDVGAEADDQIGVPVEEVLVHRRDAIASRAVDETDLELRRLTYGFFVEQGRAPLAAELGGPAEVVAGWQRLHAEHALVLNPATDELRMLNPFSVVPTAYRVQAGGRWWYGNCAWDAFGICAALRTDGRVETSCPDCGEPLIVELRDGRVDDESLVFHCLVPAAHWWDDIVFT